MTTRLLNTWYYSREAHKKPSICHVLDTSFPLRKKMIYYHLFGRKGVIEMQWLFPREAWNEVQRDIRRLVTKLEPIITLASSKLFRGESSFLRFEGDGICFALNTPHTRKGLDFAAEMDALGCSFKGIPNIIKDCRLSSSTVQRAYGSLYEDFRSLYAKHYPEKSHLSALSRRIGI